MDFLKNEMRGHAKIVEGSPGDGAPRLKILSCLSYQRKFDGGKKKKERNEMVHRNLACLGEWKRIEMIKEEHHAWETY